MFIVLDTQLDSSKVSGDQLSFFKAVTDTMKTCSNLIVLSHKLIWMRGNDELEPLIDSVSNGHYGACDYCIQSNNFYSDIYPSLIKLRNNKVNVFCVAGDLGFKVTQFEHVTDDGVVFLATGMSSGLESNSYLEFSNNLLSNEITYSFKAIAK